MIRKYASFQVLSTAYANDGTFGRRTAHRAEFDYVAEPGYLYVRSRAISSRTNDNFDTFPAEEIKKGYRTFIGKPVFVNHHNENHRRARGVIVDAALHEDANSDGSPDTWVEVLMQVDAIKFPKLAEAIVKGHIERTSMGVDVDKSVCGACGNEAVMPSDYCSHIPRMKGSKIRQVTANGTRQDRLVHEVCLGLNFFENSLLVEEPADPTAFVLGVDDRGLSMAASRQHLATRKQVHRHSFGGKRVVRMMKTAYGEVVAPPEVDTMREETCPICGADEYDGDQCVVCGFIKPPDMYMDPDLDAAGLADLRAENGDQIDPQLPGQDGNPIPEDVLAGDVLECDTCGAQFPVPPQGVDESPQMANVPPGPIEQAAQPQENPAQTGPVDPGSPLGDVPPPKSSPSDTSDDDGPPPAGKELPKPDSKDSGDDDKTVVDKSNDSSEGVAQDSRKEDSGVGSGSGSDDSAPDSADADPAQTHSSDDGSAAVKSTGDSTDSPKEGDTCPSCGGGTVGKPTTDNPLGATDANPDPDNDGDDDTLGSTDDPDHAKDEQTAFDNGDTNLDGAVDDSDDSNKSEKDDDDKKKNPFADSEDDKKSKKEVKSARRHRRAPSQKEQSMARPVIAAVAEQQKIINKQAKEIQWLYQAVTRLAAVAGLRVTADEKDPAQPIPQPGGSAGYSSTEEARNSGTRGDVSSIGGVPGATNVGAYTTDTVDSVGGSADSGYSITQDVTTPVAGTEGPRPLDEVRTRPEIQYGNAMAPEVAFPLEGDFANRASIGSEARFVASLRLARLRIQAGTASTDDDISEADKINSDDTKSDSSIDDEIETTAKILQAQASRTPRAQASRRQVPQGRRSVASLAGQGGISAVAASMSVQDDDPFIFG